MNPREPAQSFEAARRQHLIGATIEALADVGFKAASLSQIAQRANVSTGLFAHYFGDKDGLLEATLRFMAVRLAKATRERLASARDSRERLYAVPDSALADEEFDRRTSAVWLAFWGQITHSARYQRIQMIYQHRMLSNLKHDLRQLVPADRVARYATMIASMIDGVWIRSHASAQQADAAKARALVREFIDELVERAAGERIDGGLKDDVCGRRPAKTRRGGRRSMIDATLEKAGASRLAWRGVAATSRAQILWSSAEAVRREADALAQIEAREIGRPVAIALAHTLPRLIGILQHAATNVQDPTVTRHDLGAGIALEQHRAGHEIVVGAGRCNAALLDAARHAGPALAAGSAVIYRAPPGCQGGAKRLLEILRGCGLPADLLQIVDEADDDGRTLLANSAVSMSTLPSQSAATVILDDMDPRQAAKIVLDATSPWRVSPDFSDTRVFVAASAAPAVLKALAAEGSRLRIGDPLEHATQIGRLPRAQDSRAARHVEQAVRQGASLLLDRQAGDDRRPVLTILSSCGGVEATDLHAPIVEVVEFADDDALIRQLSDADTPRGAVGFLTNDERRARRIIDHARIDWCWVGADLGNTPYDANDSLGCCIETTRGNRPHFRSCRILVTPN